MRIDVTGSGIEEMEPLRAYVTQRLLFVLSRFGGQITRVGVRLVQMQTAPWEPRLDCRLTIRLHSARKILAEVSDANAYAAIDQAVERARRLVGLRLVKSRTGVAGGRVSASAAVSDAPAEHIDYPRGRRKKGVNDASFAVNRKGSLR